MEPSPAITASVLEIEFASLDAADEIMPFLGVEPVRAGIAILRIAHVDVPVGERSDLDATGRSTEGRGVIPGGVVLDHPLLPILRLRLKSSARDDGSLGHCHTKA
jgi:hypothetical protein